MSDEYNPRSKEGGRLENKDLGILAAKHRQSHTHELSIFLPFQPILMPRSTNRHLKGSTVSWADSLLTFILFPGSPL